MVALIASRALTPTDRPSIADQVFGTLQAGTLSIELPLGAKLSEVDVASQMDVSRQRMRLHLSRVGDLIDRLRSEQHAWFESEPIT